MVGGNQRRTACKETQYRRRCPYVLLTRSVIDRSTATKPSVQDTTQRIYLVYCKYLALLYFTVRYGSNSSLLSVRTSAACAACARRMMLQTLNSEDRRHIMISGFSIKGLVLGPSIAIDSLSNTARVRSLHRMVQ